MMITRFVARLVNFSKTDTTAITDTAATVDAIRIVFGIVVMQMLSKCLKDKTHWYH